MFLKEINSNLERIAIALEKIAEINFEPSSSNSKLEFNSLSSDIIEKERREERELRRERLEKKLSKSDTFFEEDGVPLEDFLETEIIEGELLEEGLIENEH